MGSCPSVQLGKFAVSMAFYRFKTIAMTPLTSKNHLIVVPFLTNDQNLTVLTLTLMAVRSTATTSPRIITPATTLKLLSATKRRNNSPAASGPRVLKTVRNCNKVSLSVILNSQMIIPNLPTPAALMARSQPSSRRSRPSPRRSRPSPRHSRPSPRHMSKVNKM